MNKPLLLLGLVLLISVTQGKHLHPRSVVRLGEMEIQDGQNEKIVAVDGMPIDVYRNMRQNRFVPINSALFFKSYPPCEEGLERDVLGICREVWD